MSIVTKTYYCPKHPAITIGQEREYTVYTGLYDNGEDYAVETDYDEWPCRYCDAEEEERKNFELAAQKQQSNEADFEARE